MCLVAVSKVTDLHLQEIVLVVSKLGIRHQHGLVKLPQFNLFALGHIL